MKIRDSGMPDEAAWESYFDADRILQQLQFTGAGDVVDFGCGYGTFSVAAARRTSGTVYALDIDPTMAAATAAKAASAGASNVKAIECDFEGVGAPVAASSAQYAMLFNVLHTEDAAKLLREAHRVLKPGGLLAMVHWVHDASTPRGPSLSIRPRPEQCAVWAREAGFIVAGAPIDLPPFHYGLVAQKPPVR